MAEPEFKAGAPGGGGDFGNENKQIPIKDALVQRTKKTIERLMPLIWIGLNGYFLYAFCYVTIWQGVRQRDRGTAVALLSVFCVLDAYLWISWIAIHWWGPGKIDAEYTKKSMENPDAAFICDPQGYSLYCSYCKHLKPNRTHHASFTDTCVPTMDHFCPWVGNVIGQGNTKFFLLFSWTIFAIDVYVLVIAIVYRNIHHSLNGNPVALAVIAGLATMFTFILIIQHTGYVIMSHTTLEMSGYRRGNIPYINFLWREGERRVIQPTLKDLAFPHSSPFDQGAWRNITNVMGPIYTWLLPIRGPIYEPQISEKFLDKMRERIKE